MMIDPSEDDWPFRDGGVWAEPIVSRPLDGRFTQAAPLADGDILEMHGFESLGIAAGSQWVVRQSD